MKERYIKRYFILILLIFAFSFPIFNINKYETKNISSTSNPRVGNEIELKTETNSEHSIEFDTEKQSSPTDYEICSINGKKYLCERITIDKAEQMKSQSNLIVKI